MKRPPLVVDPFAGGGSIPLEALRLGCEAFASDLNPVACLIHKVMLEDIPRHGPELAEELRRVGAEIKKAAEKELAELYPKDPDGATAHRLPVGADGALRGAELRGRDPADAVVLAVQEGERRRALRHEGRASDRRACRASSSRCSRQRRRRRCAAARSAGPRRPAFAATPCCTPDRVRAQLAAQRGGADVVFDAKGNRTGGATMLAVVTLSEGQTAGTTGCRPSADYEAVWKAQQRLKQSRRVGTRRKQGCARCRTSRLPPIGTLGISRPAVRHAAVG